MSSLHHADAPFAFLEGSLEADLARLARERAQLRCTDGVAVARVREEYGALVRTHRVGRDSGAGER